MTKPGSRCHRTVSLLDLYPTLVDLCDLTPSHALEGRSLRPLLQDPSANWNRLVVTTYGFGNHAIRSERWRLIHYTDGTLELYDHSRDPLEHHNLAYSTKYTAIIGELSQWIPRNQFPDTVPKSEFLDLPPFLEKELAK